MTTLPGRAGLGSPPSGWAHSRHTHKVRQGPPCDHMIATLSRKWTVKEHESVIYLPYYCRQALVDLLQPEQLTPIASSTPRGHCLRDGVRGGAGFGGLSWPAGAHENGQHVMVCNCPKRHGGGACNEAIQVPGPAQFSPQPTLYVPTLHALRQGEGSGVLPGGKRRLVAILADDVNNMMMTKKRRWRRCCCSWVARARVTPFSDALSPILTQAAFVSYWG